MQCLKASPNPFFFSISFCTCMTENVINVYCYPAGRCSSVVRTLVGLACTDLQHSFLLVVVTGPTSDCSIYPRHIPQLVTQFLASCSDWPDSRSQHIPQAHTPVSNFAFSDGVLVFLAKLRVRTSIAYYKDI